MITRIPTVREITIPASRLKSLVWEGDTLVDWADGQVRYHLDGQKTLRRVSYSYGFDAAVATSDGEFAVIYTRFGTKGLVLRHGAVIREINRSFYQAHVYEYPIALCRLSNEQAVIIHCPNGYNRLDIEYAETGKCLTPSKRRKLVDIFHSRLTTSPNGRYLLDAGWVWHPVDTVKVFDIGKAIADSNHLDSQGLSPSSYADHSCAAFDADNRTLISLDGDIDEERELREIQVLDTASREMLGTTALSETLGNFMPIGRDFVLGLYGHPHLIRLIDGVIVKRWPHIASGTQTSSIVTNMSLPVIAADVVGRRLAVADDQKISVLLFDFE